MANTEKKYYTFLNVTDGKDGAKNCTAVLTLTKPELRELEGDKKVLTCPAAFTNRGKALAAALGQEIEETDGTVWCDVQFWNQIADRFQKFLGDRTKVRIVVCGRLSLRTWTAKDGTPRQRVQISANDWFALPSSTATGTAPAAAETEEEPEALPF